MEGAQRPAPGAELAAYFVYAYKLFFSDKMRCPRRCVICSKVIVFAAAAKRLRMWWKALSALIPAPQSGGG